MNNCQDLRRVSIINCNLIPLPNLTSQESLYILLSHNGKFYGKIFTSGNALGQGH
jgi:hypothetical protein